jgi:hypothetical protein
MALDNNLSFIFYIINPWPVLFFFFIFISCNKYVSNQYYLILKCLRNILLDYQAFLVTN